MGLGGGFWWLLGGWGRGPGGLGISAGRDGDFASRKTGGLETLLRPSSGHRSLVPITPGSRFGVRILPWDHPRCPWGVPKEEGQ